MSLPRGFALALTVIACVPSTLAVAAGDPPGVIEIKEGLTISGGPRGRRDPIALDRVAERMVLGGWTQPKEGDPIAGDSSERWKSIHAGADGSFPPSGARGGYIALNVPCDSAKVMILEATGIAVARVNGVPRVGDIYGSGITHPPVQLKKGDNSLLFSLGRGAFKARLVPPKAEAFLDTSDPTTPDLLTGAPVDVEAAVIVVNATDRWRDDLEITATLPLGSTVRTKVPTLAPVSTRKVGFAIRGPAPATEVDHAIKLGLEARSSSASVLDGASITLRARHPDQTHKRTFRSGIDGSVQYYGVVPPLTTKGESLAAARPGLVLTLHGAGVEAIGQAQAYAAKPGLLMVAPTNRRPYGFDWEDWGRLDALEVLDRTQAEFDVDRTRTYLTGHSMGGHGTWHLGVTFPDRFAAIAPSAGWVSMFSYAGLKRSESTDAVDRLLVRSTGASDTLALVRNLAPNGVYILHGDADDNVPVEQARIMRRALGEFHPDFVYHEQPGAGHWWGNPCVDWPPLFAFLGSRVIPDPAEVARVDFTTASPGVSNRMRWATIEGAAKPATPSAVHLVRDRQKFTIRGTTENVSRLTLDVAAAFGKGGETAPITVELDGKTLGKLSPGPASQSSARRIQLAKSGDSWSIAGEPGAGPRKTPARMGPFKAAFRDRFLMVVATQGDADESAWALARARYDAETFWYRGNGSVDIVRDVDFVKQGTDFRDRGVILYGDRTSNAAWPILLAKSPVQVDHGRIEIVGKVITGDDLACLFVRPRPDGRGSVAVVTGTGPQGRRLTEYLPYFTSGVAYPDCFVVRAPAPGKAGASVVSAGYFGEGWDVESGEFAGRD